MTEPEPRFSQADLDRAKADGFARGERVKEHRLVPVLLRESGISEAVVSKIEAFLKLLGEP